MTQNKLFYNAITLPTTIEWYFPTYNRRIPDHYFKVVWERREIFKKTFQKYILGNFILIRTEKGFQFF